MNPYIPDGLPLQNLDYQMLLGLVGDAKMPSLPVMMDCCKVFRIRR